jgi:hypothetical protein
MTTFGMKASEYTGPFESLYEEHEAAAGNRGHQAEYMASQAQHSRGLRAKGLPDTSFFGTRRDLFGNDYYTTVAENPLNVLMDFQGPAAAARMETSAQSLPNMDPFYGPSSPQGLPLMAQVQNPSSSKYPILFGGSDLIGSSPKAETGIGQFFTDLGNAYRRSRQDLGMGIANLFSGGAFSNDVNKKVQGLKDFGYSDAAARDYVQRTQEQARRLRFENALYGDNKPGQNVGGGQPAISEEILNETNNENVDAASSDAYNLYVAPNLLTTSPIQMAQGGLMSLRRR